MAQQQYYTQVVESETDTDDSQQDPSFDIFEETQSKLSNLSIKKKPRSRVSVELNEEEADCIETVAHEFDATDEKSFQIVQKMIEGCQVEKLKVEQCKLYLRKHGLRLTGKKDVLIQRIKEHVSIMNGEGELKYPASSFVMNCKGDACTGDVVMFEQNVYEMFSIASRSAIGPPCGQRIVAGRIVKESYGAAKQQHTFTIEVLWSTGTKPLPPLHPLLIKGRNLYRLKTMRQRWEDESERQKILSEKHARGNEARNVREARIHEKEMKKALRENRATKAKIKDEKLENKRKTSPTRPIISSRTSNQHSGAPVMGMDLNKENMNLNSYKGIDRKNCQVEQITGNYKNENQENKRKPSPSRHPMNNSRTAIQHLGNMRMDHGAPYRGTDRKNCQVEHITGNYKNEHQENKRKPSPSCHPMNISRTLIHHFGSMRMNNHGAPYRENMNHNSLRGVDGPYRRGFQDEQNMRFYHSRLYQRHDYDPQNVPRSYSFQQVSNNAYLPRDHYQGKRQQLCRYYAEGRCHYGTNCKFLH
ncbi:uncharacterized protein LOC143601338 [Bidens hawaiensis]|uniref:uncharacterized protein LOC143601338 n=1 Tax=Bidens hawaiensis TaxID=980011 RepID=UPI00404B0B62